MPSRGTGSAELWRVGAGFAGMASMVVRGGGSRPARPLVEAPCLLGPGAGVAPFTTAGPTAGRAGCGQYSGAMFRSLGALAGDLLVALLFVAIGLVQHGTPRTTPHFVLVGGHFAVAVLLVRLERRARRDRLRIWPHGVFVWASTLATATALSARFCAGTETSFVIVTAVVTAVGMLGWRMVAQ